MRDILKYILYALCVGLMASCELEEIHEPVSQEPVCKEIEFVARPTRYINSDVTTKATVNFDDVDNKIYSAYFLVYDTNGRLIRYQKLDISKEGTLNVPSQTITTEKGLEDVTVCYIANLPEYFVKENMTATSADGDMTDLEKLQSTVIYFYAGTSANPNTAYKYKLDFKMETPTKSGVLGMPSIDPYDETGRLNEYCLPMFGYWTGNLIGDGTEATVEIPVKRLFSKVTFTIKFNLNGAYADPNAQYDINSIVVKNIPKQVTLFPMDTEYSWVSDNGTTKWLTYQNGTDLNGVHFLASNYIQIPNSNVNLRQNESLVFTFYVPEYIVEPVVDKYEDKEWYIKPDNSSQWYKPLLFGRKTAPYVDFGGILSTKGQNIELDYKIYLGENNFDNFSHKRNYHYKHDVLLYDIYNADTSCENGWHDASIAVDHRVNMTFDGFLVGFQRATLLDSHFEVRPMRVKFDPDFISKKSKGTLKVEIVDPESSKWLRLERPLSEGGDLYCQNSTKRKYFTTNLVTEILVNDYNKVISYDPFDEEKGDLYGNVPIWVYVDEWSQYTADQQSDSDPEPVRRATIRVTYTPEEPTDDNPIRIQEFTVQQRAIYPIESPRAGVQPYGIEYFEEYLHDYDDDENYGADGGEYVTSQSGIKWGFYSDKDQIGTQLSNHVQALYVNKNQDASTAGQALDTGLGLIVRYMSPYYDFYMSRDIPSSIEDVPDGTIPYSGAAQARDFSGYEFNQEVVASQSINERKPTLAESVNSAVEYCYNKNKRNEKGEVVQVREETRNTYGEGEEYTNYRKEGSLFSRKYYRTVTKKQTLIKTHYQLTDYSNLKWYLPAIDEMEEIITNGRYIDFFREIFEVNWYWSCQPAYDKHYLYIGVKVGSTSTHRGGLYYTDDLQYARATKLNDDPDAPPFMSSEVDGYTDVSFYFSEEVYQSYGPETAEISNGYHELYQYNIDYLNNATKGGLLKRFPIEKNTPGVKHRDESLRVRCIYNPNPPGEVAVQTGQDSPVFTDVILEAGKETEIDMVTYLAAAKNNL